MAFSLRKKLGGFMAAVLNKPIRGYQRFDTIDPTSYEHLLRPGDLLLVEGNTRFSVITKYLTQSTWSHVAMYIGPVLDPPGAEARTLIEADVRQGVIAVPLSKYRHFNVRVCRPVGLNLEETQEVTRYLVDRLGMQYDLKNITDMLRYFLPKPWIFSRNRRRYLELGSGDPTRAICSSLIAQAFQSIGYPILPRRGETCALDQDGDGEAEYVCKRHHSLFAPRDFDLSPYFDVVKPTLESFSHHEFEWREPEPEAVAKGDRGDGPQMDADR